MVTTAIERSTRSAITLIIATFLIYLIFIGSLIYYGFNDAVGRAEASATAAAKTVRINTGWIVEVASQALRRMDSALGKDIGKNRASTLVSIRDALEGLPTSAKAYIVAADGQTLYTTDPKFVDIDIRDREYFSVPAKGKHFYTSSLLISRIDGSQIFVFSRRLERNGLFIGVAVISFDADILEELHHSMDLGAESILGILRLDGMLVARYPLTDPPLDLSHHVLFKELILNSEAGVYTGKSPVDGSRRFVGYQSVPETELVAIASVGAAETMGRFWLRVKIFLTIVVPTTLALTMCAFWISQLLKRDFHRHNKLEEALATNTKLFREIHHRVKNNMQSMQALVKMQSLPEDARSNFQLRLAAMSAVHEHMYNNDSYAALDATAFISSVTEAIFRVYGSSVRLELDIDQLVISHEQATSLAMLINEVVTNALKYAFSNNPDPKISISLKQPKDNLARLVIEDNGPGFDPRNGRVGMGTKIIKGMVMQLDGSHTYTFNCGTKFATEFPIEQ